MEITPYNIWTFIIASVALVAGIVTIITFTKRKKKELTFKLLCNVPILSVSDHYSEKLSVTFEGTEVKRIYRFAFVIINTGNIVITKDDYEGPLNIALSDSLKILDVKSSAKLPTDINLEYKIESARITINPFMLNPKEYFVFDTVIDGENHDFSLFGRIKDISEFNIVKPSDSKKSKWRNDFPLVFTTVGISYILASFSFLISSKPVIITTGNIVVLSFGFICFITGAFALLYRKYSDQEEGYYLLHANSWIDVQINRIKI